MSKKIKYPLPSDGAKKILRFSRITATGVHCIDTEVRSLEQACDLIAEQQRRKKLSTSSKKHPMTRRQLFALAKGHAWAKLHPKPKKEKIPHPFRDLTDAEKCTKAREMFDSDHWGWGIVAHRRLAKVFNVPVGQIAAWLEE